MVESFFAGEAPVFLLIKDEETVVVFYDFKFEDAVVVVVEPLY